MLSDVSNLLSGPNNSSFVEISVGIKELRSLYHTFPSFYRLLACASVWNDTVLVSTPARNYTANDYQQLFNDIGHPQVFTQFSEIGMGVASSKCCKKCWNCSSKLDTGIIIGWGQIDTPTNNKITTITACSLIIFWRGENITGDKSSHAVSIAQSEACHCILVRASSKMSTSYLMSLTRLDTDDLSLITSMLWVYGL